jgi:hypothetical protein
MDDTKGEGEIEVTVETELLDVDGDGVADVVREVVTTVVDVDGDGVPDIVEQTTTIAYDLDGDGVADVIESATVTGVDANRDGTISEDEITVDGLVSIREDFVDRGEAPRLASDSRRPLIVGVVALAVVVGATVWWRRRSS